jgi:hypothetical protein
MSRRSVVAIVAAAAGAAIGFLGAHWWSATAAPPALPAAAPQPGAAFAAAPDLAAPSEGEPAESHLPAPRSDALPAAPAAPEAEREDRALFPDQLRAFAAAEIARGWRELRADDVPGDVVDEGLRDYERQLQTRAHWFGRSAAEQIAADAAARDAARKQAALFAGDDGVALLAAIRGDEPEAKALVASDRFAALFVPRGGGSAVDGTSLPADGKVADGAVVSFPAGVFALRNLARGNDPYPVDLTVRGAGMDATLLVVDAQSPRGEMRRLALHDCTLFVENALTDVRSSPAVLSLLRVRVIGFDCGAGHVVAFYLFGGAALSATACRFESGYGRHPGGYANLISLGGAALARFDRCVFERMSLDYGDRPAFVYADCTMIEMLSAQPQRPTFRNCRYTTIVEDKKWDADYRRRDLNTLFPQWKERLQRR